MEEGMGYGAETLQGNTKIPYRLLKGSITAFPLKHESLDQVPRCKSQDRGVHGRNPANSAPVGSPTLLP